MVYFILTNEKYKGDALYQKKYAADYIGHRMVTNGGEVRWHSIMSRISILRLSSVRYAKWCTGLCLEPFIRATRYSPRNWYTVIAASHMGRKSGIRQANTQSISTDSTQNTTKAKRNANLNLTGEDIKAWLIKAYNFMIYWNNRSDTRSLLFFIFLKNALFMGFFANRWGTPL